LSPRLNSENADSIVFVEISVPRFYRPTNAKLGGSYRGLKIELVQPGTDKPLVVKNEKGRELKYQVITREGYTARHPVE
jgi:hypothetical protein